MVYPGRGFLAILLQQRMAKAYSNDLRRKILERFQRGDASLSELAERFGVSHGYTKKIRKQQLRTGQMERPGYRAGRRSRVTPEIEAELRSWVQQQPDMTLQELQQRLQQTHSMHLSIGRLWLALRQLQLRRKKNTPRPGTRHARKPAAP
jgi:transposase